MHTAKGEAPQPNRVVILPERRTFSLGLAGTWPYRDLLYFLVWRDLKVRYKQTILGALWAVLQPVLTMVVFTFVFNRLAGIEAAGVPYPLFSLAGLLPWTFFSQGLTQASNSLVNSSHLISKVYFPRVLMPTATVIAGGLDFGLAFLVLIGLMAYFGYAIPISVLALPGVLALAFLTTLAAGLWLSAINVRYRDVRYIVPFFSQLWMFVSPVIYPASEVFARLEVAGLPVWLYGLNPMVTVVEGFRWAVLGAGSVPLSVTVASGTVALTAVVTGLVYFRNTERGFADVV